MVYADDMYSPLSEMDAHSKAANLEEENRRLRALLREAVDCINAGVDLMPDHHLSKWQGVRAVLERLAAEALGLG